MKSLKNKLFRTANRFLLLLAFFVVTMDTAWSQGHHDWTYNLAIYEVNIRQYTPEGTFAAFSEHLDRLEDLGVGILWLMPIHPIGVQNRLGSLGSYYSVKDFMDVNPEFGTFEDFADMVEQIHARGMYVMLDWVPNHTSWDNHLTIDHPEWYITDNNGNFMPPPGTNWSDVIQLDHSQQGLRDYMVDAMTFWIEEYGVDGFRFDAAGFVPMSFWEEVLPQLQAVRADVFLLAEDNGPKFHEVGFDMSFGWDYYGFGHGVLKRIADGQNNANHLSAYIYDQINEYPEDAYRMYFTSNHDENSWYGTTQELFGDFAEVFAVLTCTIHGMPLIYSGQEAGLNKRLAFFHKDLIPWQEHPKFDLYKSLFDLKRVNKALWNGPHGGLYQRVFTNSLSNILAFIREKDGDRVFVATNLSANTIDVALGGSAYVGTYKDAFTGEAITLEQGAVITLPPYGYVVYHHTTSDVSTPPNEKPEGFGLRQNYPNPFNPATVIAYSIPHSGHVSLEIFSVDGRRVAAPVDGIKPAGTFQVVWDATGAASGLYLYRLTSGGFSEVRKMLLMK